jgi:hypothetical protein
MASSWRAAASASLHVVPEEGRAHLRGRSPRGSPGRRPAGAEVAREVVDRSDAVGAGGGVEEALVGDVGVEEAGELGRGWRTLWSRSRLSEATTSRAGWS